MASIEDLFCRLKEAREKVEEWKRKAEEALGDIRVNLGTTEMDYNPMKRLMQYMVLCDVVSPGDLKNVLLPEDIQVTVEKAMDDGKIEWTADWRIRIKKPKEDS